MSKTVTAQEFRDAADKYGTYVDLRVWRDLLLVAAEQRDHLDTARSFAYASNEAMVAALQARDAAESRQLARGATIDQLRAQVQKLTQDVAFERARAVTLHTALDELREHDGLEPGDE